MKVKDLYGPGEEVLGYGEDTHSIYGYLKTRCKETGLEVDGDYRMAQGATSHGGMAWALLLVDPIA